MTPRISPRFVADVMLGKLARWLRVLGYDVLYCNRFQDEEIVLIADQQERVILTRDTRLILRRRARLFLLIDSDHYPEQLRQVIHAFRLDTRSGLFTRCVPCNGILAPAPRQEVARQVPEYTFRTQEHFARCGACGRIYWRGTHWGQMRLKLEAMLGGTSNEAP